MNKGATISECGTYRYWLSRRWQSDSDQVMTFIMLNPSVADAEIDDPTIKRCIGFARDAGCGGINVVNLFALRATDPAELAKHKDPIGPDNEDQLRRVFESSYGPLVVAWGNHAMARTRGAVVAATARAAGREVLCLGKNKNGTPKHPLYVPQSVKPHPYYGS